MPSSYAVGEHVERFIKQQIEAGRYAYASEVVRDGLRLLEVQERMRIASRHILRAEIRAGLDSGAGKPAEEFLARLERKYARTARSAAPAEDGRTHVGPNANSAPPSRTSPLTTSSALCFALEI